MDGSIEPPATGVQFLVVRFCSPSLSSMKQVPFKNTGIGLQYTYAETKHVLEQPSEIRVLECRLKNCKTQRPSSSHGDQPAKPALVYLLEKVTILAILISKAFERCVQQF